MAPRRRGPPPKQPAAQSDDESAESGSGKADSPTPTKRRGRPPKPTTAAQADDGLDGPSEPAKRRGRPPKPSPPDARQDAAPADTSVSPEPSKRRGRPLKPRDASPEATLSGSPSKTTVKQQRGRRAKPVAVDEQLESVDTEAPSLNQTADAEKHLVAALKPLSLKRKAGDQLDQTALKRARAGRVFVFGSGECAQLGLTEDKTERKFPAPVDLNDRIVSIACGGLHNVAVTSEGDVWTWGCNDEKALGRAGDEWVPGKVAMPVPVTKATAGDSHSMALGADGRVYTWGAYRDTNGLMGFNPKTGEPSAIPIPISFDGKRVVDIASGVNHSLVLLDNGCIYEWGHVRIGQRVARHHRMNLLQPRLVNVRRFGRVTKIFAGAYQSFALTDRHTVFAFGMNQYGQSGVDGARNEQLHKPEEVVALRGRHVVKIAGGLHHSLALLADGHVLSFGRNNYGELGMGDLDERRTPTLVPGLDDIVDIACGSTHSLAVSKGGRAFSCGFGEMLQLGNGESEDRKTFEKVGGQQIEDQDVVACAAGAQHSVLIVCPRSSAA